MALSPILSIAASGLQHESNRLAVTANNVANLQTEGYAARQVLGREVAGGGVESVVSLRDSLRGLDGGWSVNTLENTSYNNPYNASSNNVDMTTEAVSMITALRAFEANAAVIRTDQKMVGSFLDRLL